MSGTKAQSPTVAIIGAGLTGLVAAHGLKKAGFQVVLFDRENGLDARLRDWPISVHWAVPTLQTLLSDSALANFSQALSNPHLKYTPEAESMLCINGQTGEVMIRSVVPGLRRISRQRLRRVLAAEFTAMGAIQWNKTLESIGVRVEDGDSVRLIFTDGTTAEADYVLGTDGASSKTRELLFGGDKVAQAKPSGLMCAMGFVMHGDAAKVEPVVKLHPLAAVTVGTSSNCGVAVMYADDPEDMSAWTIAWIKIWRRSRLPEPPAKKGPEALAYVKATSDDVIEPFRSQIESTLESDGCYIDEMRTWVPVMWDTYDGRVTLAGDAAHPMLVYRGQGFQHAVVDAESYVQALISVRDRGVNRGEAVKAYTANVVERGAKAVLQSLAEAEMSMDLESVEKTLMAKQGHARSA